eukprot:1158975-Pelagomonas_calceolata.AAC.18
MGPGLGAATVRLLSQARYARGKVPHALHCTGHRKQAATLCDYWPEHAQARHSASCIAQDLAQEPNGPISKKGL